MYVKAKKELGQHFLKDQEIAARIVQSLMEKAKENGIGSVLEVGPGTGVLTSFLVKEPDISLKLAEIDNESVRYLRIYYPSLG